MCRKTFRGFFVAENSIYCMYTLVVTTPPATEPVTAEELKAHLRLNDDTEDDQLEDFITTARVLFEEYTGRAVVETEYRQYVSDLSGPVTLMKYPVISLDAVKYTDQDGTLQTSTDHSSDLVSIPARIWWTSYPNTNAALYQPVAYVDFTAGYADVPKPIKTAIKLLAGHYYEHREEFQEASLTNIPEGFKAVCNLYKTGLLGTWGM